MELTIRMKMRNLFWLTFLLILSYSHGDELSQIDREKMERGELEGEKFQIRYYIKTFLKPFCSLRYFGDRWSGTRNGIGWDLHSSSGTFPLIPVSAVPPARGQVASLLLDLESKHKNTVPTSAENFDNYCQAAFRLKFVTNSKQMIKMNRNNKSVYLLAFTY